MQTLADGAPDEQALPRAKEVWRWVKSLVQDHIMLKEQLREQADVIKRMEGQ